MSREDDTTRKDGKLAGNRITRRRALATTTGLGGALFGVPSAAGQESDGDRDETYLTEEELLDTLRESEHIIAKPEAYRQVTEGVASPDSLEKSDLPGHGTPDIYYGKYKNAEPPSGKFYEITEAGEWRNRDVPVAFEGHAEDRLIGPGDGIRPDVSDFLTVGGELGSTQILGTEVSAAVEAGLEISASTDVQVGGELVFDITLTAAGQSVVISPGGFGFWVGPDTDHGYCANPKVNLPGPLPGGQVELCGDLKLYTNGGIPPNEIQFGLEVGFLDICADPCPGLDCEVCGTVIDFGFEFRTPWIPFPG